MYIMQTFERQMRKVFDKNGKLKEYNISLGVNSQINEERFYIKQKDKKTKNKKDIVVCDVLICFPDEYMEFMNAHKELESQIESMEKSLKLKDKSIKDYEKRLSNIKAKHKREIKELDKEYADKIDKLNADLHDKDLEIERTKTKYEKEIGNLKAANQKEINGLKLFDEKSHMSINDHKNEILNLKDKHQKELNELNIYNEEYHMKIQDHQSDIFDLKEEHWKEYSGIKDRISLEVIHHNDNLNDLEKSLKWTRYIRGHHKKEIEKLKGDIKQFELIAQYIESKQDEIIPDIKLKEADKNSSLPPE